MVNASGVPSVILNYVNEADYAKTLTMANSKFMNRVLSYQLDFNPSLTEFYKKVLIYSSEAISNEKLDSLEYSLNPPRTLNNTNMTELLSNVDQLATGIVKALVGENNDLGDEGNFLKDAIYTNLFKEMTPNLNWEKYTEIHEQSKLEYAKFVAEKKMKENSESSESSY